MKRFVQSLITKADYVYLICGTIFILGVLSAVSLPLQLVPSLKKSVISVETIWPNASPLDVDARILEPQERELKKIPGIREIVSTAEFGAAFIVIKFHKNVDVRDAIHEVNNRVNRTIDTPPNALPPRVQLGFGGRSSGEDVAIAWYYVQSTIEGQPIDYQESVVQTVIADRLARIEGVKAVQVKVVGERPQLRIQANTEAMIDRSVSLFDIVGSLSALRSVAITRIEQGSREIPIQLSGKNNRESLEQLVVKTNEFESVRLGQIASITTTAGSRRFITYHNGHPAIGIRIDRTSDADMLSSLQELNTVVKDLNSQLKPKGLRIVNAYDPTNYLTSSRDAVLMNLLLGSIFSSLVMWASYRSTSRSLVSVASIPFVMSTVVLVYYVSGSSLNVLALAGLAFTAGIVVDSGVVITEALELQRSDSKAVSVPDALASVYPALTASILTSLMVFVPILIFGGNDLEIFSELLKTISIGLICAYSAAMTLLPVLFDRTTSSKTDVTHEWLETATQWILTICIRYRIQALVLIFAVAVVAALTMPPIEYLPHLKRPSVDVFVAIKPGKSINHVEGYIAKTISNRLTKFAEAHPEEIDNHRLMFFSPAGGIVSITPTPDSNLNSELFRFVKEDLASDLPDISLYVTQGDMLAGIDGGRQVQVHLTGQDIATLEGTASALLKHLATSVPGTQTRVLPGLDNQQSAIVLNFDTNIGNELGWSEESFRQYLRFLGDGLFVGEFFDGKNMPVVLSATQPRDLSTWLDTRIVSPTGKTTLLRNLARVESQNQRFDIRRVNGQRSLTIIARPPDDVEISELENIVDELYATLIADKGISLSVSGSRSNRESALPKILIVYFSAGLFLLAFLSAFFRSVALAGVAIVSVALSLAGGVLFYSLASLVNPLSFDLTSLFGGLVASGVAINNSILLISEIKSSENLRLSKQDGFLRAIRSRMRALGATTLTTVAALTPLAVSNANGSDVYQGFATSIIGVLISAFIFTPICTGLAVMRRSHG